MEIKLLKRKDIPTAKNLWGYAFEKNEPFYSWYFEEVFQPENTLGVFVDKHLISSLQLNPYQLFLHENPFSCSYVVGVVTAPEYRNRGFMKPLLKKALEEMAARNHHLSILMPFDTHYYVPYGWELCYSLLRYETPIQNLKKLSKPSGFFSRIDPGKDLASLDSIYQQYLREYHGHVLRSERDWQHLLQDLLHDGGHGFLLRDENQEPIGYMLYYMEDYGLHGKELAYTSPAAQKSIFDFLYRHKSQIERVSWDAPFGDVTHLYLQDTITPKPLNSVKVLPFMAGRIVNVKGAFEHSHFSPLLSGKICIEVEDSSAPWNHNRFLFDIQKDKIEVREEPAGPVDVHCKINTLSQLFWGVIDIEQAEALELVRIAPFADRELLSGLFQRKKTYIHEYF